MTPIDVIAAFLQAYEAKDIEAIAPMLADDVRLQDWNRTALGKQAVLAETGKNSLDAEQLQIEVRQLYGGERCAAAQLRIVGVHPAGFQRGLAADPEGKSLQTGIWYPSLAPAALVASSSWARH